jgi:hypothetical protein
MVLVGSVIDIDSSAFVRGVISSTCPIFLGRRTYLRVQEQHIDQHRQEEHLEGSGRPPRLIARVSHSRRQLA